MPSLLWFLIRDHLKRVYSRGDTEWLNQPCESKSAGFASATNASVAHVRVPESGAGSMARIHEAGGAKLTDRPRWCWLGV
jgi:hypothetical protein